MSLGNSIFADDIEAIIKQQNYTFSQSVASHLSLVTGLEGWGTSGNEANALGCTFPETATTETVFLSATYICPDVVSVNCSAYVNIGSGSQCSVIFTLGAASATLSFTSSGAANSTTPIATSSSGTGWQVMKIQLRTDTASGDSSLDELRIEDAPQTTASSIRDPAL